MLLRLISLLLLTSSVWAITPVNNANRIGPPQNVSLPPIPPKCALLDDFSGVHASAPVADVSIQQQTFYNKINTGENLTDSYAYYLLGVYTDQGVGTLVDPVKATTYFYMAAVMGDLSGQYALAIRNLHGITMAINTPVARAWFKKIMLSKPLKDSDLDPIECARWHYTKIQLGPPYF